MAWSISGIDDHWDMKNSEMAAPIRSKLEFNTNDTVVTQDKDDPMFKMKVKDYIVAMKTYQAKKDKWDENQPRAYNLVLQHCPAELKTRLTSQANWDQVWVDRDVVGLLKIIRGIAYNHDESKLGLMVIIECDMELYLGFQAKIKDCDNYMAMFKAWADTINDHKGLTGKNPKHVWEMYG